jgi:UrcA family protein
MKTASSTTSLIACAVIAGAFAVGFATGPAFAQESTSFETESFKFHFAYRPSELTAAPSAEKLLVRLQQDVRAHCGGNRKMSLDERSRVNDCINSTMKESIGKFGSSTLAQAYETRTGG